MWLFYKKNITEELRKIDKSIVLHTKDNTFCKVVAWILFILSFGNFKREVFLNRFSTTIANHHFYPEKWLIDSVLEVGIHEARHTRQFRFFGFWIHPLVGLPIAAVVYLLLLLPIGAAFGRFFMELDADKESWRYMVKEEYTNEEILEHARRRANTLSGSCYLWAVPKFISSYFYTRSAKKIIGV
jgi:hypothetical protein